MAADWDLLQAIFEGALDRPKAERAAFLDESTNGAGRTTTVRFSIAPRTGR
jgi:hypothetical protein